MQNFLKMKSILGIGNALTDILAVLPDDSFLKEYHLPEGSMQHIDKTTSDKILQALRPIGFQYVAGGSAANAITGTAILGMPSGFIGKVGDDEVGKLFRSGQEQYGIKSMLLNGVNPSGRAMTFIDSKNGERTFATYLGAALELVPEDLNPAYFQGWDYFHIEGYLVQNQSLILEAAKMAKAAGCIVSIDMASYNVVESNCTFLHELISNYVDIVFANEAEARAFTGMEPKEALVEISRFCDIAIVKTGKTGSMVKSSAGTFVLPAAPAEVIDATGAGDLYASGFLYAHALGLPVDECGWIGTLLSSKVIEVIGAKIDIPRWKTVKRQIKEITSKYELH